MADNICGIQCMLPMGVATEAGRLREFQVLPVGGVTERIMVNDNLRNNHSQEWMGRLVASVLDNIGGVPVYTEFRKSDFKEIPKIVKDIPLQDASFILTSAHMNTYGPTLKEVTQACPSCSRKDRYVVDLSKLEILDPLAPIDPIVADLKFGFLAPVPTSAKDGARAEQRTLEYHGKTWNRFLMRPPTIRDAILHEKYCTKVNLLGFHLRLVCSSVVGVESWGDDSGSRVKLFEMADKDRHMLGMELLEELNGADRQIIRRAVNEVPRIDMVVKQECSACGDDVALAVDVSNFFPLS